MEGKFIIGKFLSTKVSDTVQLSQINFQSGSSLRTALSGSPRLDHKSNHKKKLNSNRLSTAPHGNINWVGENHQSDGYSL